MKDLESYISPEAEILYYAAHEALCYDDSWMRSGDDGSDYGGIELPDDN